MDQAEGLRLEKVHCAEAHLAQQADPAGTAPHWDAVMAIEIPSPWPRDISACEPFASLTDEVAPTVTGADGRTWRPQGLVCEKDRQWIRLLAFERGSGSAGPFTRREWLLPAADGAALVDLAVGLVAGDVEQVAAHGQWRDDPDDGTVDLLLCTHGTRDVCCGGSGTALHAEVLAASGGADTVEAGRRRRIWRTSHAGGHRFAPTALSFPEGVSWAHLDAGACRAILARNGDGVDLGGHVRGALSLPGGVAQVADREGFGAFGWDWLEHERSAVLVSHDRRSLASTVDVMAGPLAAAGGVVPIGVVSVDVELDRHIATPTCGAVDDPEFETEPVWKVARVQAAER